jgi:hypothetical protein
MKARFGHVVPAAVWFLLIAGLAPVLPGQETDLAQLRAKAEKGNAIAQYNLGLAYAEGKALPKDPIEAYVWMRLAIENGGTGTALGVLVREMSADDLAAGRTRLEERRHAIPTVVVSNRSALAGAASGGSGPVVLPLPAEDRFVAMEEELATLRVDKVRLGQQIASLQNSMDAAIQDAVQARTVVLTTQLEFIRKELAGLRNELARANSKVEMATRSSALLQQENDQLKARLGQTAGPDPASANAQPKTP